MALRPQDRRHVTNLTETAAFLRSSGKQEWADTVDLMLSGTQEATEFLNRLRVQHLRQSDAEGKYGQNLAIYMPTTVREEIKANVAKADREHLAKSVQAAQEAGIEIQRITVSSEANKALEAFLTGEFTPAKPERAVRGTTQKTSNLNVRVDPALRQRAEDFGADNAARFGWAPRASHVIAAWLIQKFTEAGQ